MQFDQFIANGGYIETDSQHRPLYANELKDLVLKAVSEASGFTIADILSKRRSDPIIAARWTAVHMIYQRMRNPSTIKLGRWLNRDHSTILHALNGFEKRKQKPNYERIHEEATRIYNGQAIQG